VRRLIGILAVTAVLALSGVVFAGIALAQTPTTAPTATTKAAAATTATTARPATTATTAKAAAPAARPARTGARTDFEVTVAGTAFMIGGALLFFGQPLRRARKQS